jgi:UTP--glucose-1-phosphate uridylyltransferase
VSAPSVTARPSTREKSESTVPVDPLAAAQTKLREAGAGDAAVATFLAQLKRVQAGERGMLAESDIEPVDALPDADEVPAVDGARAAELLANVVVIKLNGGLGTSMGLEGPKSLLPVKQGLTFLDVIARQVLTLRSRTGARLPLVLMNSFATQAASLQALDAYPDLAQDVPRDFLQNKVPKLRADDLVPVSHPAAPELEWAPPGHGDLYPALVTSGMLDALLDAGYQHAFVSNSDNLGATLDVRLLGWFADLGAPFALEAADRTPADRKGGHLARRAGGTLVLRETAQTPDEDLESFQDIDRHRYFNTNNLWIDLNQLRETLDKRDGVLELPLIVNRKTVDPKDSSSQAVLQLETAMGSAIDVWDGAQAIRVPRSRFGPVKTTNDLLAIRSDAYVLDEDALVSLHPTRLGRPPLVDLDPEYYRLVGEFDRRFSDDVPSLLECQRLTVRGDVRFESDIVVRGSVELDLTGGKSHTVTSGTVLSG